MLLICKRTASPAAHDVVGGVHILVMRKLCIRCIKCIRYKAPPHAAN